VTAGHILYLTNQQLTAVVWRSREATSSESFPADDQGFVAFARYLERFAGLPAYLMLDLIEEDFRLDTLPGVGGRDRDVILARRLQQLYRGMPYRYAQVQGREPDGRRDWRVMYTAITNSDLLQPWLAALEAHRIPLVGIYSAPLLVTSILKELRPLARHALVVSLHEGAGLRQNYVRDGFLKFSRLSPLGDTTPSLLPNFVAEETERTWQYLSGLNHFGPDDHLQVVIVTDRNGEQSLRAVLQSTPQLQYEYRGVADLSERLGMRSAPAGGNGAALYVHALAERTPPNHFATPELMHHASLRRVRAGLWAAAALVVLVCGATSAVNWIEGRDLAAATAHNEDEMARVRSQEAKVRQSFPPTRVRPDLMNATVVFYDRTVGNAPTPEAFLGEFSRVMPRFPAVALEQIVWSLTPDPRVVPPFTERTRRRDANVKNTLPQSQRAVPTPPPAAAAQSRGYYQVVYVEGTIGGPASEYRRAIDTVRALNDALTANWPGVKVEAVSMPIDPGSQVGLVGRVDTEDLPSEAHFVLKLTLEPPPPTRAASRLAAAGAPR
jgi:hypothetical protein